MKVDRFREILFEAVCEYYQDRYRKALLKEDAEKEDNMVFSENETTLPNSTDQILAKFPTLRHALVRLQTEDFGEFISGIDWISPKPTEFRINLKNGQSYTLKWMGKDFEATISGKKYYIGQLPDFQQALSKLSILYKEGPVGTGDEESTGSTGDSTEPGGGFSGGGSGNFPGESGEGAPEEEPGGESSEEEEGEPGASDLDIDFESDEEI